MGSLDIDVQAAIAAAVKPLQDEITALQGRVKTLELAKPPVATIPANLVVSSLVVNGPAVINGDLSNYGRQKRYIDDRINPATKLPYRAYAEDQTISMAASAAAGHDVVIAQKVSHTLAAELDPATGKVRVDLHDTPYLFGANEINQRRHHETHGLEDVDGMSRAAHDFEIVDILPTSRLRLWGSDVQPDGKGGVKLVPTPTPKDPVLPPGVIVP
jgi:hypothetical protein